MSKGSTLVTLLTSGFIIICLVFIVMLLYNTAELRVESYAEATMQTSKFYIFQKIASSKSCLSTGDMGALNKTLLDDAAADGGELECAYIPDCAHYVRVDNLENGKSWDWEFGLEGYGKFRDKVETHVTIDDGNKAVPGLMSVEINCKDPTINELEDNFLVCLAAAAERAWIKGELTKTCNVGDEKMLMKTMSIYFKPDEICLEDGDCRRLQYAVLEETTKGKAATHDYCKIRYVKGGDPTKLTVDYFYCGSGKKIGIDNGE